MDSHAQIARLVRQYSAAHTQAEYGKACLNFEALTTEACNLLIRVDRSQLQTLSDHLMQDMFTAVQDTLKLLAGTSLQSKSQRQRFLAAAEKLCDVLWVLRKPGDDDNISGLRYTLIRRLAALHENDKTIHNCWALLKDLFQQLRTENFDLSQVEKICGERRGDKLFVTMVIGLVLNLISALIASPDRREILVDGYLQVSNIMQPVLKLVLAQSGDFADKYVRSFTNSALKAFIVISGLTNSSEAMYTRQKFVQVILFCLENSTFNKEYLLQVSTKLVCYSSAKDISRETLTRMQALMTQDMLFSIYKQLMQQAVKTDTQAEALRLLDTMLPSAVEPWLLVTLKTALHFTLRSNQNVLSRELACANVELSRALELDHPQYLFHTFCLLAREVQRFAYDAGAADLNCTADFLCQIRQFAIIGAQLAEYSLKIDTTPHAFCAALPSLCLSNALLAIQLETNNLEHKFTHDSIAMHTLSQLVLLNGFNTLATRRSIHTLAQKCAETGHQEAAEALYRTTLRCCDHLGGFEANEVNTSGERHGRIKTLFHHLHKTSKENAVKLLLSESHHYGTSEMPFKAILVLYAEISTSFAGNKETFKPFIPQLVEREKTVEILIRIIEECLFWDSSNISMCLRHQLKSALFTFAIEVLSDWQKLRINYSSAHIAAVSDLLQVMFPPVSHGSGQCRTRACAVCGQSGIIQVYHDVLLKVARAIDAEYLRLAVSIEFACRTALALISINESGAFKHAQMFIQEEISLHELEKFCRVFEEHLNAKSSDGVRRMFEAIQDICEKLNTLGSTHLSNRLRHFICPETTSHVAAILLAPIPAPCLLLSLHRHRPWQRRISKTCSAHQGRSKLLLAGVAAERGHISEAFSYVEIALSSLRNCLSSYHDSVKEVTGEASICDPKVSYFFVVGTYISALCTKATICAEIGMVSSSLHAFDEALKLSRRVCSHALQGAVHLRKAGTYQRLGRLTEARDELLTYHEVIDGALFRRTQESIFDTRMDVYAKVLSSIIECSCCENEHKSEFRGTNISRVRETIAEISAVVHRRAESRGCQVNAHVDHLQHSLCASLLGPFRSIYARLLYLGVLTPSDDPDTDTSFSLLGALLKDCRNYEPILVALSLSCELKLDFSIVLPLDMPRPGLDSRSPAVCMSIEMRNKVMELLWRCRDTPIILWELQSRLLSLMISDHTQSPCKVASGLQTCYGAVTRSQYLALLTLKTVKWLQCDEAFVRKMRKMKCDQFPQFASAVQCLQVSREEIAELAGVDNALGEKCRQTAITGSPVLTIGIVKCTHTDNDNRRDKLIISRVSGVDGSALCVQIANPFLSEIFHNFSRIIKEQKNLPTSVDSRSSKIVWWEKRLQLDASLRKILSQLDIDVLGAWRVLLLGDLVLQQQQQLRDLYDELMSRLRILASKLDLQLVASASQLLRLLIHGLDCMTDDEFRLALSSLLLNPCEHKSAPVCLVLSSDKQSVLQKISTCEHVADMVTFARKYLAELKRTTSLTNAGCFLQRSAVIVSLDDVTRHFTWESLDSLNNQRIYRTPSVAIAQSIADFQSNTRHAKNISSTFFVLNPTGDLLGTQQQLEPLLTKAGWDGVSGTSPTASELIQSLQSFDFYLYFGHGGGQDILKTGSFQDASICTATVLMGCSSGVYDIMECSSLSSISMLYLLAGAPIVIANMWDVTDRDIDRFSSRLLEQWLSYSMNESPEFQCASDAVRVARYACQLKYLVGAAPIIYGVPTSICRTQELKYRC
ncbi:Separase, putative [Ostreococcus lucimarinus CCE9901]|uniref:separase n=1 Tax=Ostreococcus lucimarinus (strain CCE9901) TaxID=436017 RepID=A4RSW3_OSTLU|nr:Separase, putative [Ostreococcus lucimarinus CCE9901]ABO94714.1 Separase, putative [Ostreococcus lucimarinus CCE9901]|eukprot:XP_001416421.1 Separase, putative [Ostreococcus lucimarinus CCE9901]